MPHDLVAGQPGKKRGIRGGLVGRETCAIASVATPSSEQDDSMQNRKTPYVSMNVTKPARDSLRRTTLDITTPVGSRISMSDVIVAALQVAMDNRDQFINALKDGAK